MGIPDAEILAKETVDLEKKIKEIELENKESDSIVEEKGIFHPLAAEKTIFLLL